MLFVLLLHAEATMAVLQVRDIPDDVYLELSTHAKNEQRSITQEAIVLLKQALHQSQESIDNRLRYLDKLSDLHITLPPDATSPIEIIREDRNR
jgi:plasmid stability protein